MERRIFTRGRRASFFHLLELAAVFLLGTILGTAGALVEPSVGMAGGIVAAAVLQLAGRSLLGSKTVATESSVFPALSITLAACCAHYLAVAVNYSLGGV